MDGGTTLLLVSHSAEQSKQLRERAIWLDTGEVVWVGDAGEVWDAFIAW